jgi:hypothetical protein
LGLILYRNTDLDVVGAIYLHTAIRNPWSAISRDAWQCLGGIMVFSDDAHENKDAITFLEDVVRKSTAMTDKFQFIDENLSAIGHDRLAWLGGGKATASHPAGEAGRMSAVMVTATVAASLGIYISGSDQNMTTALCTRFAERAPRNFMGAMYHPIANYGGLGDPSPCTALGVYHAFKTVRRELFADRLVPVFFQGFGNVGTPMVRHISSDRHPIAGIIDTSFAKLLSAREKGITAPLFLQVSPTERIPDLGKVNGADITIVTSLIEALSLAPETEILSPNAGPHPITMEVAIALSNSNVRAIVGATNNTLAMEGGSVEPVANFLQQHGIYNGNDSEGNQVGAASVVIRNIGADESLMERLAQGVEVQTRLGIRAFRDGIPPQLARDRAARRRYAKFYRDGRATGGHENLEDIAP